jgi:hypothetical protein
MKAFRYVTGDQSSIVVFALDEQRAFGLYCIHFEAKHGAFPNSVCLDARPRSNGQSIPHLKAALAQGVSGVGTYDPTAGWTIRAPNNLLPGEAGCCPLAHLLTGPGEGDRA